MALAYRTHRTYDHRLRDGIAITGNVDLYPNIRIPRSTRATWARCKAQPVVTANDVELTTYEFLDRISKLNRSDLGRVGLRIGRRSRLGRRGLTEKHDLDVQDLPATHSGDLEAPLADGKHAGGSQLAAKEICGEVVHVEPSIEIEIFR